MPTDGKAELEYLDSRGGMTAKKERKGKRNNLDVTFVLGKQR